MAKQRIQNYVFLPGVASSSNAYPDAYWLIEANKTFIKKEAIAFLGATIVSDTAVNYNPYAVSLLTLNKSFLQDEMVAWINYQVTNGIAPFVGYTYDAGKCRRDLGYIIDALIYDVRYGGNEKIISVLRQYWLSGVAQVRQFAEVAFYGQLRTMLNNNILSNSLYISQQNPVVSTQQTTANNAEDSAVSNVFTLLTLTANVIQNGLSVLPAPGSVVYPNAVNSISINKQFLKDEISAWIAEQVELESEYNLKPNAYSSLLLNKTFIGEEAVAWINLQIAGNIPPFVSPNIVTYVPAATKADIGFVVDAIAKDLRFGGNENLRKILSTYWINGVAQIDGPRTPEVATYEFVKTLINNYVLPQITYASAQTNVSQNLSGSSPESGVTAAITNALDATKNTILLGLASLPAAAAPTYPFGTYTYDIEEFKRDVGYVVDAYIYDLSYGGNEKTRETVGLYWAGTTPLIDGSRIQEGLAHTQLRDIIKNYIIPSVTYETSQVTPIESSQVLVAAGEAAAVTKINTLAGIVTSVIANGLTSLPALQTGANLNFSTRNFAGYTYDSAKCERDMNYVLDAYLNDLRYGGNYRTRFIVSRYWEGTQAQVDGDRKPEIAVHNFIRDLINNRIIPQSVSSVPYQSTYDQITNLSKTGEQAATPRISALAFIVTNVITNGLSAIPALANGVTAIKVQGKHELGEILLITNTSNNEILYNFSDPTIKGIITYDSTYNSNGIAREEDFPKFLQTADYVTTITLDVDTSNRFTDDQVQIFVEQTEMRVRPYDFGTDAIERMRVGLPQSMLDADFEYGLQPTKWQAIGISRGYPSVYEIPGTDTQVLSVVTDASTGTGSIGQSLITVTTAGSHGFTVGTPVTIRALANTISGFSRAEGTFLVQGVPSLTTFTYYAVSKVGTSNGQVLATTYTQLRKGAFYTGAALGQPTFSVASNGTLATLTTVFETPAGGDQLAWNGSTVPDIGSPLAGAGIGSGAQITAVVGTGGLSVTSNIEFDVAINATSMVLTDATGVLEGMAINNGTGTAIFVSGIASNTISFTGPITTFRRGNTATYINVSGTNINSNGTGATFSVDRVLGVYQVAILNAGSDYIVGNRIKILGTSLGGTDGVNDLIITASIVTQPNGVLTFDNSALVAGTGYTSAIYPTTAGTGTGLTVNVIATAIGGATTATITSPGSGYADGPASTTYGGGGSGFTLDITTSGGVVSGIIVGQPGLGYTINDLVTLVGGNNDATVTVTGVLNGGITSVTVNNPGTGYTASNVITIDGGNDDATITVLTVGGGRITGITTQGVSITGGASYPLTPQNTVTSGGSYTEVLQQTSSGGGSGARFNVVRQFGAYGVTLATGFEGTGYAIADTVTLLGTLVGGSTPANDITITITGITDDGSGFGPITTFTVSGTGTSTSSGADALFTINRSLSVYTIDAITTAGTGYLENDNIVILGTDLGGLSPDNDLIITVTGVDLDGGVAATSIAGVAITGNATFGTQDGANIVPTGTDASFNVTRSGGSYTSVVVNNPGDDYFQGDQITILGTDLGGLSPTHDATIRITGVTSNNVDSAEIVSGVAITGTTVGYNSGIAFSELTTAVIPAGSTINASAIALIEVIFQSPHGLVPGANLLVDITSAGTNHALAKGPFYAEQVPTVNTVRYTVRATGTVDTGTPLAGIVYARPDSYFVHRPYDGGVQLGTGGPQHGAQAIRMSKKYIRYQSGKGIMYTTGALFAPSYSLQNLTATGTTAGSYITVTTDDVDHGCQVGGVIRINGVDTGGYNGTYTVVDIINERQLRVQAQGGLANVYATITTNASMAIQSWHGATVRAGVYDDQNGMYWQYDGKFLAVGRRSSTLQLSGVASIARDTNVITGNNTRFRDQIKAGDRIVIKGMTHVVSNVTSQTSMSVTPDYRGAVDCIQSKVCLVQDVIVNQQDFNLDRLDGTGPSGYNIDTSFMQMIGIQYSWYGAGFIDYMLRGSDGNYVYAHRIRNSNVNTEAYMRTGNLPVRYEVINESAFGKLAESITRTQTTIPLLDASAFPDESGIVYINNELIAFSGKVNNSLVGCTRGAPMTNFVGGAQRTFRAGFAATHEYNTGVILVSNTISPIISHWGSAFITDGLFDEDRGYIFNYAATGISISTTKTTAFLIRLAPSVSNAIVGDLGERELINRAQLLLKEIAITSDTGTGGIVIEGVLNPQNYPLNPSAIAWGGLAGLSQGGQPSFAQIAPGGSVNWNSGSTQQTATGTTLGTISGNLTVPTGTAFNRLTGTTFAYVTKATWDNLGATTGFQVSDAKFSAGTTVTAITPSPAPVVSVLDTVSTTMTTFGPTLSTAGGSISGATATVFLPNQSFVPFPVGSVIAVAGVAPANFNGTFTVTNAGTNFVQYTVTGAAGNMTFNGNVSTRYPAGSSVLRITKASWEAMTNPVNAIGFRASTSFFPADTFVTAVSVIQGATPNQWYNITFSKVTSTVIANNVNIPMSIGGTYGSQTTAYYTSASWNALPVDVPIVGAVVNDAKFSPGTTISSITALRTFAGTGYYAVVHSTAAALSGNQTVTYASAAYYTVFFSSGSTSAVSSTNTIGLQLAPSTTATNTLYFTQASWELLVGSYGISTGTEVSDTKYPAGTRVQTVSALRTFSGSSYYIVTFTQTSNTVVAAASTITFRFGNPPFALPGETVFSFIAQPGGNSALDLSELKELTNTTLGGRGTYPNGPDVLAINVYKVSGTAVTSNIVVRWGEAQA